MIDILTGEVLKKFLEEKIAGVSPSSPLKNAVVFKSLEADVEANKRTIRLRVIDAFATPNGKDPKCDAKNASFLIQCYSKSDDGESIEANEDALKNSIEMALAINDLIGKNPSLTFENTPRVNTASTYPAAGEANMDFEISYHSNYPYGTTFLYGTINPT